MKLAQKLSVTLALGVLLVIAAFAYLRVQRETSMFENDMRRDHTLMATILSAVLRDVWLAEGEARALAVLGRANASKEGVTLRWIWFDEDSHLQHGPWLASEQINRVQRNQVTQLVSEQSLPTQTATIEEFMFTIVPLSVPGVRKGAIEISESLAPKADYVRSAVHNLLLSSLVTAFVCGIVAVAAGRWFVGTPVAKLIDKARRVGTGDLSGPLVLSQRDELGLLATEINAMCERLAEAKFEVQREAQARILAIEQLRHADRLTALGRFTSAVAHELGTPLNVISGHAQLLAKGKLSRDAAQQTATIVIEQCERMTRTVRQLLSYSRRREPKKSMVQATDIVSSVIAMLTPVAQKAGITLELCVDSPAAVYVDAIQIQQALTNLVVNAIHASPGADTVFIDVRKTVDKVVIAVRDHGVGIPQEAIGRVFEPFFTTKDSGEGTGLGLSISKDIVSEHGGTIHVTSEQNRGSCFELLLPAVSAP